MFARLKRFTKLDPDFRPQGRTEPTPAHDYALPRPATSDLLHQFAYAAVEAGVFDEAAEAYLRDRACGSTVREAIHYARREWDF